MGRSILRKKCIILLMILGFLFFYTITVIRIEAYINKTQNNQVSKLLEFSNIEKKVLNPEDPKVNHEESTEKTTDKAISLKKIGPQECVFQKHQYFPHCNDKVMYLKARWTEPCFQHVNGVDGSACSIYNYLTKVEPYCPFIQETGNKQVEYAVPNYDLNGLLKLLPGNDLQWLRQRATDAWPDWTHAGKYFSKRYQKYEKKKVALFLGSFGFQPHLLRAAGKGGPLGELIQWTDILCGLYILGYDVNVYLNATHMNLDKGKDGCASPPSVHSKSPEVIYTDSNGVVLLINELGASHGRYRCRMRLLDSFGTWPEYNDPSYPFEIPGGRSPWANLNLLPPQFFTLYPHTHDNTFLGFVVGSNKVNEQSNTDYNPNKKYKAILYAKFLHYCEKEEHRNYLRIVSEYFQIESTAIQDVVGFDYIYNHGPVSGAKVKELLQQAKVFVGCGFPYEGPGPLEAMAAGTPMIQPKFPAPKNKLNDPFFGDKPTLRLLTSQSPYMEEFVGEPYVFTINITDEMLLRSTLEKIKNMKPLPPKIPKEFTNEGMLERLHVYTEHMDFCDINKPKWPPLDHMKIYIAELGKSCKDTCMAKGFVCERSFFDDINNQKEIERYSKISCSSMKEVLHLHAPSFNPTQRICYTQQNTQLYSCSHRTMDVRQICPCRDYEKGQFALCNDCL